MVILRKHPRLKRQEYEMRLEALRNVLNVLHGVGSSDHDLSTAVYLQAVADIEREIARLEKRRQTKFYLINRLATYLRKHAEEFELNGLRMPTERVEEMLTIIEDEGGVG